MLPRKKKRLSSYLKLPEFQFFLIFIIPLIGFFLVSYDNITEDYRVLSIGVAATMLIIALMQTLYGAHIHRRMQEEEGNFIDVTAHEMRTPLTAIRWMLQELSHKDMADSDRDEMVRLGTVAAEKLSGVIDTFSEVARLDAGQIEFHLETIELIDFMDRMVRGAEPIAKQFGVRLNFERQTEGVLVSADALRLEMVFTNLINNAIKYNKKGGSVTVRSRRLLNSGMVEVTIEDTGIGITSLDTEKLFQKYYRSDEARRINPEGSGLGLYLVKRIIAAHHGKIWVESVHGRGTAFHFTLPIQK